MTRGIPVALIIAALLLLPLFVHDAYFLHVLILIGINVMVAVSMWLLGITGLISFGQAGFMFIGAMTTALLTKLLHWPFWVALPLSAMIPALVAAPVGRLSLRVKGVYFFLVTLAFGQVVNGVFAYFQDPFGGWYGIRDIPAPQPASLFTTLNKVPFYYLGLALTLFTCGVVYRVSRSWFGNVLWSIRESELLASSVGIDVPTHQADRLHRLGAVRRPGGQLLRGLLRLYQPAGVHIRIFGQHADLHRGWRLRLDRWTYRRRRRAHIGARVVPRRWQVPAAWLRSDPAPVDAADAAGHHWQLCRLPRPTRPSRTATERAVSRHR